ncbi:hypothetical protein LTR28_010288 [Elasticomyces elasticus]|nr:hypothetical protein LTR28_010288 [Elasticomyces elasticus]
MHKVIPHLRRSIGGSSDNNGSSNGHGEKESRETIKRRESEKQRLAEWHADKRPLETSEILMDPAKKAVGHSSKVLRCEDFELLKTLGTGTFARVWLARLKKPRSGDANKVFALKVLRKVDGEDDAHAEVQQIRSYGCSHPAEASRAHSQRTQCACGSCWTPFHHDAGS